jgi:aspartyl-tRNA(Asn)/glutamyl-tRNA(Gln) amidotransferase subunit B
MIKNILLEFPELPQQKRERFKIKYQLDEKSIEIFVQQRQVGEFFEKVISEFSSNLDQKDFLSLVKLCANYILSDLLGLLKEKNLKEGIFILPKNFAKFCSLIYEGKISSKIAKMVLEEMLNTGKSPETIIEEKQLVLIEKEEELEEVAKKVILENQKAVLDFKSGKTEALQFLIGKMMAATKGKAHPQKAREILIKILKD